MGSTKRIVREPREKICKEPKGTAQGLLGETCDNLTGIPRKSLGGLNASRAQTVRTPPQAIKRKPSKIKRESRLHP